MDLLSTACTAERREKSHCNDAGTHKNILRYCWRTVFVGVTKRECEGGGRGAKNTENFLQ